MPFSVSQLKSFAQHFPREHATSVGIVLFVAIAVTAVIGNTSAPERAGANTTVLTLPPSGQLPPGVAAETPAPLSLVAPSPAKAVVVEQSTTQPQSEDAQTDLAKTAPRTTATDVATVQTGSSNITGLALPPSRRPALVPNGPARDKNGHAAVLAHLPPQWTDTKVRRGESLSTLFTRVGLKLSDLAELTATSDAGKRLRRIHPGDTIQYQTDDAGRLFALRHQFNRLHSLTYYRSGEGFEGLEAKREPERLLTTRYATINNNLFLAGEAAGLSPKDIMNLAGIFQWDIDFVLDIRRGDHFSLLIEELYLDGEQIGTGDILAAQFYTQGELHQAVRYVDPNNIASYYAPEGRSMRKAFLRAPVEFSRISSNFNPRRLHPVLKRVVPHRGIDYAAPIGTPVFASGDGKVTKVSKNATAGRHIEIRHGEQYRTRYLHLSAFARGLKTGARVRQGQTIGFVGRSGRVTGPHLHYEFLVNGVHRNPRTVSLPKAAPVQGDYKGDFAQQTQPLLLALKAATPDSGVRIAALDNANDAVSTSGE